MSDSDDEWLVELCRASAASAASQRPTLPQVAALENAVDDDHDEWLSELCRASPAVSQQPAPRVDSKVEVVGQALIAAPPSSPLLGFDGMSDDSVASKGTACSMESRGSNEDAMSHDGRCARGNYSSSSHCGDSQHTSKLKAMFKEFCNLLQGDWLQEKKQREALYFDIKAEHCQIIHFEHLQQGQQQHHEQSRLDCVIDLVDDSRSWVPAAKSQFKIGICCDPVGRMLNKSIGYYWQGYPFMKILALGDAAVIARLEKILIDAFWGTTGLQNKRGGGGGRAPSGVAEWCYVVVKPADDDVMDLEADLSLLQ